MSLETAFAAFMALGTDGEWRAQASLAKCLADHQSSQRQETDDPGGLCAPEQNWEIILPNAASDGQDSQRHALETLMLAIPISWGLW